MKILIFGGTGAMGVSVVELLEKSGHTVYITSRIQRQSTGGRHYILGNAHNNEFVKELFVNNSFDVLIDFMVYNTKEFKERVDLLLSNVKQYIFFSSSRVYADSSSPIKNASNRLLDVCYDKEYLKTDEYALTKARQENLLQNSGRSNWTIIRPYITYNFNRLQLGVYEKEHWLYRALRGKPVVFSKDIADKYTTLTYGGDVAIGICRCIGNEKALGKALHITCSTERKWLDIWKIYSEAIAVELGDKPQIIMLDNFDSISNLMRNKYQVKYDRLFDRRFNKDDQIEICGDIEFYSPENGLSICLSEFISKKEKFNDIDWRLEGYLDKISGVTENFVNIAGIKNKIKYIIFRFLPLGIALNIKKIHFKL